MSPRPAEPSKRASWRSLFAPISRRPFPPPSTGFEAGLTPEDDGWEHISRSQTLVRQRGSLARLFGLELGNRSANEEQQMEVDELGEGKKSHEGVRRSGTIKRMIGKIKNGSKGSRGSTVDAEPTEDTSVWRRSMSRVSREFGSIVGRGKGHDENGIVSANPPRHSLQDHIRARTSISSVFPATTSPPRLSLDFPLSTSFFDDNSPPRIRIDTLATVDEDATLRRRPLGVLTNLPRASRLSTSTKPTSRGRDLDRTPRRGSSILVGLNQAAVGTMLGTDSESSLEIQGRPSIELSDAISATSDLESLLHSSLHHSSDSPTPSLHPNPSLESLISTTLEYLGGIRRIMVEEGVVREEDGVSVRSQSTFGKGGSGFSTPDRKMSVTRSDMEIGDESVGSESVGSESDGIEGGSEDDEDLLDEDVKFILTPTHLVRDPVGTPPPSPTTPKIRIMTKASLVPSPGETTPITTLLLLLSQPPSPSTSLPPSTPTPSSTPPPIPPTLPLFSTTPRTPFRPIVPLELRNTSPFKRQFSPIQVFRAQSQKRRLEDLFDEIERDLEVTPTSSPRASPRRSRSTSDRPKIEPLRFSRRAANPPPPPPTIDLDSSMVTTRKKRCKTMIPAWVALEDTIVEEESWQVLDSPAHSSSLLLRTPAHSHIVSLGLSTSIRSISDASNDERGGLGHLIYEATQEVASSRSLWPTSSPPHWTRPQSYSDLEKFLSDSRSRFKSSPRTPERNSIEERREERGEESWMESLGSRIETNGFKRFVLVSLLNVDDNDDEDVEESKE